MLDQRSAQDDAARFCSVSAAGPLAGAAAARPTNHVVMKDGQPFAILNATPAVAQRTLAGFARATPQARWALARC